MTLISAANRAKIKNAVKSVTDTYMTYPIVYKRRTTSMDRFRENNTDQVEQIYNLKALVIFNSGAGGIRSGNDNVDGLGIADDGDGYILFHIDDLRDAGLITANENFLGFSNSDVVVYNNENLLIRVSTLVAPLIDENLLVRLSFKREIKNG